MTDQPTPDDAALSDTSPTTDDTASMGDAAAPGESAAPAPADGSAGGSAAPAQRLLAVAAHPDDLDFGAAGTIAGLVREGAQVTYLLCTRGDQGGFDDTPREQMPVIREREQRAAAAALGVSDVRFLDGYRDGWLEPSFDLQRDIVRVIRQVRPTLMLISSPERNWNRLGASHPDHMAAGEASIRAVYPAARNAFAFPELLEEEGLEPWSVPEVWVMADPSPDHVVRIDDTFGAKLAALREHVSQTSHRDDLEAVLRAWGEHIAQQFELPQGAVAEAFRRVLIG